MAAINSTTVHQLCVDDPGFFVQKFVRVQSDDGPMMWGANSILLEFIYGIEDNQKTISRYPRRLGKTTALVGYALHQALFHHKRICVFGPNMMTNVQFMRALSYAYHHLPVSLQGGLTWASGLKETADHFTFEGKGEVMTYEPRSTQYFGHQFDVVICDEMIGFSSHHDLMETVVGRNRGTATKYILAGTFRLDDPVVKPLWEAATKEDIDWVALPSLREVWRVGVLLDCVNPMFARDYK